jgi:Spy/CpxP family protein refolding chaperone
MNFSRKTIALYMGLVFVSGAALGVFGDHLYTVSTVTKAKNAKPSPEEFRRGYLGFMQKRLSLSDDQVTHLGLILDDTRARMNEVHDRTIPEQQEIQKSQSEKIRALLSPAQQAEYDVVIKERRERMKKNGSRGPGGF